LNSRKSPPKRDCTIGVSPVRNASRYSEKKKDGKGKKVVGVRREIKRYPWETDVTCVLTVKESETSHFENTSDMGGKERTANKQGKGEKKKQETTLKGSKQGILQPNALTQ